MERSAILGHYSITVNVHTCLVKRPPYPHPLKVASALTLQTAREYLQQCSCGSHRGLLEGMVGLLTTSAHARRFPSQQPAEKGREVHNYQAHVTQTSDTFSLQWLCSIEQKGHWLV